MKSNQPICRKNRQDIGKSPVYRHSNFLVANILVIKRIISQWRTNCQCTHTGKRFDFSDFSRIYWFPIPHKTYDIKTDEWYRISLSSYPNIRTSVPTVNWGNHSYIRAVYDLSFSRVVYPAADEQYEPTLILWDIENEQEIIRFNQGYDNSVGGTPQWSQDGSFFIAGIYPQRRASDGTLYKNVLDDYPYEGGFELFQDGRDGEIKRLTYFTTKYHAGEEAFALSPDEKLIAFWLNLEYQPGDQDANRTLAILNIETGKVVDLCFADGGKTSIPPVWSPDGKYLVVSRYAPRENKDVHSDSVLIDLEQNLAINVGENIVVVGWLTE